MKKIFCLFISMYLGVSSVLLHAENDHFPENAQLCDYLVIAANNNQELVSAFNQWRAALEVILEVDVLPDPRFTYKYFITPVETRTGPQRSSYSLLQTFPWMGKLRLRGKKAEQEAYVLKSRFDQLLLELYLRVKQEYFEYAYLFRAISTTKEILDLLQYVDNVARTAYSVTNVPYADVIRTQLELGRVEDHLRSLEDLKKPTAAKLNAAMNLQVGTVLPEPGPITLVELPANNEELALSLHQNNPQLIAFDYIAKSEEIAERLARKEFYPDFTFGIETIATGSARTPNVPDSGKNPVIASVSINLPIWQESRNAAVRKAKKRFFSALEERRGLEENLLADLELSLYRYRDAKRKINLYGKTLVPIAKESLAVILHGFETQKSSFIDLIDAERTLFEMQLSYERALADHAISLSEIESLTAQDWQMNSCCLSKIW